MGEYEDLLLSITKKYDDKKNEPLQSKVITNPTYKEKTIGDLTEEEEEKQFYQSFIDLFISEKKMSQTKIDRRLFLDIRGGIFLIRKPFDARTWALYRSNQFLVRVTMLGKDEYKFKVPLSVIDKIQLNEDSYNILLKKIIVSDYVNFTLGYDDALTVLDNFGFVSTSKRNDLLDMAKEL